MSFFIIWGVWKMFNDYGRNNLVVFSTHKVYEDSVWVLAFSLAVFQQILEAQVLGDSAVSTVHVKRW